MSDSKEKSPMFSRFTDRARKVMGIARKAASEFKHSYIGTEHILLGLIREESGVAAHALKKPGLSPKSVLNEVKRVVAVGTHNQPTGELPFTPLVKKCLEATLEESAKLGHNYIGTEHLLLGLLMPGADTVDTTKSVALQVIHGLGAKLDEIRDTVLDLLGAKMKDPPVKEEETTRMEVAITMHNLEVDKIAYAGLTLIANAAGIMESEDAAHIARLTLRAMDRMHKNPDAA